MEELLRAFMRSTAQQVYLVTARGVDGYAALTATSVTSISLRPPLMMVAVAKGSQGHDVLVSADAFILSILGIGGEPAARSLAERGDALEKLRRVGYSDTQWGPLVVGSSGYLALRRYAVYDGGDHSILLGEVVGGEVDEMGCPLLYHDRRYTTIQGCSSPVGP